MLDTDNYDWLNLEEECPCEPIRDGGGRVISVCCHLVKTSEAGEGYSRQQHQKYSYLFITAVSFLLLFCFFFNPRLIGLDLLPYPEARYLRTVPPSL